MSDGTPRAVDRRTVLAGLAGLVTAACARDSRRTIRVATLPRFTLAPLYVADEQGFFRDAGLRLDVQLLTETTQTIPLLAAGRVDVAFSGATPALFNAISQGARTRIVAVRDTAVQGCSQEVHGSRKTFPSGFSDAARLKGKRVAVTAPASLTAFLLDVLLASASLKRSDIDLLTLPLSQSAPALIAGTLDAVVDLDMGFTSRDVVPGPSIARLLPGFQYSYMLFGRVLLDGDVAVGAALLRAYLRGVHAFRAGAVPRAMDQLARASGMDPAVVRTACRDRLPLDGHIDTGSIQRMIDWSVQRQFVRAAPEPERVIDRRFLEAIRP